MAAAKKLKKPASFVGLLPFRPLAQGLPQRILLVAILVGPLFFSGVVFSTLLKGSKDISAAMAYNLMGAMLGGALEYNSMRFGFSFLYLIALVLYGLAWVTMFFTKIPSSWHQFARRLSGPGRPSEMSGAASMAQTGTTDV
jgi:hypothetical protein